MTAITLVLGLFGLDHFCPHCRTEETERNNRRLQSGCNSSLQCSHWHKSRHTLICKQYSNDHCAKPEWPERIKPCQLMYDEYIHRPSFLFCT